MDPLSGNKEIGLIFSRSALGHEAGGERRAAGAVYQVKSDLGICLLEQAGGQSGIINDVDSDLTFRFSGL